MPDTAQNKADHATDLFTPVHVGPLTLNNRIVMAPLFAPGARTAWHTHPGQTLIITAGCGRVQREHGPVEEVHPGDVIWFPPG